jgi:hypothetical protein
MNPDPIYGAEFVRLMPGVRVDLASCDRMLGRATGQWRFLSCHARCFGFMLFQHCDFRDQTILPALLR